VGDFGYHRAPPGIIGTLVSIPTNSPEAASSLLRIMPGLVHPQASTLHPKTLSPETLILNPEP